MSGDNVIPLAPTFANSVLGINGDNGKIIQVNVLKHLVKYCTSLELPDDNGPASLRQSSVEDHDHLNILLSIVTALTDCIKSGVTEDNFEDEIIIDLFQSKRPTHPFFSQVYKRSDNGLPSGVLATFCDVSVVKFFSRCGDHSSYHAVDWCLQYFLKMFSALDPHLQSSGSGWYNAKVKARKASSIAGAHLVPFSSAQMGGAAESGDHQSSQPQRRKSGYVDYSKLDMTQLNSHSLSIPETLTLESHTPPVATMAPHFSSRNKRNTFRLLPIVEEPPPDIISSIDMSIIRFSPDLTDPCNPGNDPLVCMPQPDSLPSSPTGSNAEAEVTKRKKSVKFIDSSNEEVDLVGYELQWGVSCEGRVGLIAILNAIAKLHVKLTHKLTDEKPASKIHDDHSLWNEAICSKVFKLIQKCLNSSMYSEQDNEIAEEAAEEAGNAASYKRRAYRMHRTKPKRNVQQKSLLASYYGHVLDYALQALVQCALFIRCSTKTFCPKQVIKYTALCGELHDKLSTICTHSGASFKKYLQEIVKKESVEKVLAFLHATLGFCAHAADDDNLGNWYEHKVKIVVSVLKSLMDKIVCLDLTESPVKISVTHEASRLVVYSLDLLSEETFEFVHSEYQSSKLKKYILYTQRLVLSSISPIVRNIRDSSRVSGNDEEFVYTTTGLRLWNNLPIDELKLHVERFVVLMHLSEPGTIPSAGLLASIIDMTSLPVLVRAVVLFECALYVNRIRNGWFPPSLQVNYEGCKSVLINFKHWGEAIGSKLEELEDSEHDKVQEEEPVLPREAAKGYFRVSFSLKMMACQLLAEITYLLRDPCSRYNPFIPGVSSPYSTIQNTPRVSNITAPDSSAGHNEHDEVTMAKGSDNPRTSAGSLEPGVIQSRSNSLDVPRLPINLSDQSSDTSGGEEVHKKSALDTPAFSDILRSPMTLLPRLHLNLDIPSTTPEPVPSIVIASSPSVPQRPPSKVRRGSLPQEYLKKKPLTGSFDKQSTYATSPTSYIHRKLSTFKDSFRRVRSAALKSRKSVVTKVSSPLLNRRKSLSTPMSRAGSHKSLCDDALCSNLPWLNVVARLYHHDMIQKQDNTLMASCKTSCAELEGCLRRLYTLPPRDVDDSDAAVNSVSPVSDDSAFPHSSFTRREKAFSFTSFRTSSFASSGTFSFNRRFSRPSFTFSFRRHSQMVPPKENTIREERVATSLSKSVLYDEELYGDDVEGALEKHVMMLQSRKIKGNDDIKIRYLNQEVKGLLHTPFTILQLAMAANLIDTASTINNVREICWHLLLDSNQGLVQSAAMTFLWTVEKCKTLEFNSFFNQNVVIDSSLSEKLKSITRFMILWRNRHNCSLNEKDALRRLKMKNSPIGYALPSPLLGLPLSEIPVAPWESYTICSADNCEENAARCHKPTRLVPKLYHLKDLEHLSQSFSISGISVAKKSSQRPPPVDDSSGAAMATDVPAVSTNNQTALFPSTLLCFLQFLIDSVTITDIASEPLPPFNPAIINAPKVPCTSVSDAARMALWTCMVEDHDLFFQPFLACFKRENMTRLTYSGFPVDLTNHQQLENVLHSLRCLIIVFHQLPSEAAQYLFNHLIGVIMQHRLQPYNCSNVVISEVLVLLRDVAPSVQGLDCKVLKNVLKKEKCYNTVMTTANLQAVQGKSFIIKVECTIDHHRLSYFHVNASTTFRELTTAAIKKFKSSFADSSKLDNCILIDDATKQPMLDDLFIQDHYYSSVRDTTSEDNRYIVFQLQQSSQADKLSFERRSLFWYKMGEISRIVFSTHMLFTGPSNMSSDGRMSATTMPHYQFMHDELSELGSFPRKALDNILHLNEPMSPSIELRITDIMLKGVWIHFIFMLLQKMPDTYPWSHEIIYFISVVTGSLLLYADDAIILQGCLSTLLLAATKFNDIVKERGYNTVVPILVQVYTLHHHNKVVIQAIEHIWGKFYFLNDNVFVMQAVTSLAALLCSRTNNLEGSTQLSIYKPLDSFISDFSPNDVQQRAQSTKAIFQLIKSLREHYDQADVLDIEDRIHVPITRQGSQHQPQSPASHAQQEFLYTVFDLCIAVAGAHPDSLRGMQMMVFLDHHMILFLNEFDQLNDERWNKHITGIKALVKGAESLIKVFRTQHRRAFAMATNIAGGTSGLVHQDSTAAPLTLTLTSILHRLAKFKKGEEENSNQDDYKKDLMEAQWKRTRISSLCLLSLCSKFVHHLTPTLKRSFSRYSNTVQVLVELFTCEVKLIAMTSEKLTLENRGLTLFMTHFLPSLSWSEERSLYAPFSVVLKSIGKLFRKYQAEPPCKETWEVLVKWMSGVTSCLSAPGLAHSQSRTIKVFIDNVTGNGLPADSIINENYFESWPWEFSRSLGLIIYQMIKHNSTIFSNYLIDISKSKKSSIKTILIPFCVEYGQHECLKLPKLMQNIFGVIESHLRTGKQVQSGMQALRAFAVSFVDQLEYIDWSRITLLVTTALQEKCAIQSETLHTPVQPKTFMSSLDILKSVIELCSPFVSSYRTSLGLLLKTLLTQVESKLQLLKPLCKHEPWASKLSRVIDRYRLVKSHSLRQFSKTTLLSQLENELRNEVSPENECNPQTVIGDSDTYKTKFVRRKKTRLKANPSFKGESGLELIKEDMTDPEPCSPRANSDVEEHSTSPRRILQHDDTLSDSDDGDEMTEHILPAENRNLPPAAPRKRTRTVKSRLMALHRLPTEDYDGDYEDEAPTPMAFPDRVFQDQDRPTTLVEVHHTMKKSRSSDSSVEASNDSTSLIPNKSTSSVRKVSLDRYSATSPSVKFNLMEPLKHGNNSLKQLKNKVFLKGHSFYESTV